MTDAHRVIEHMFKFRTIYFPKRAEHKRNDPAWQYKFNTLPLEEFLDFYWPDWKNEAPKAMSGQLLKLGIRE